VPGRGVSATGSAVPWHGLFLAYGVGMTAGSVGLTPGGLGVIDAALSAGLVASGISGQHALAAVLVYRLISFWLVMAVGWAVMAFLTQGSRASDWANATDSVEPHCSAAMAPPTARAHGATGQDGESGSTFPTGRLVVFYPGPTPDWPPGGHFRGPVTVTSVMADSDRLALLRKLLFAHCCW
jgi:hypothetical protein